MNEIITKVCITCKKEKEISEFHFRSDTKKYRNECQECNLGFHKNLYRKQAEKLKAQAREYSKKYYPTVKEKKKKYAKENKEKIQARMFSYQKDYYIKNKEYIQERHKKWETENSEKRAVITSRRRSLQASAEGSFSDLEWLDLCKKYGNKCLCCGEVKKLTVDHVIPLILGGANSIENIQPLCKSCNSKKGGKEIDYR